MVTDKPAAIRGLSESESEVTRRWSDGGSKTWAPLCTRLTLDTPNVLCSAPPSGSESSPPPQPPRRAAPSLAVPGAQVQAEADLAGGANHCTASVPGPCPSLAARPVSIRTAALAL